MQPGRNDPCPCGSGKKYKKCCESARISAVAPEVAHANAARETGRILFERMLRFARMRPDYHWPGAAIVEYTGGEEADIGEPELQLVMPWALYDFPLEDGDASFAFIFREEQGNRLSPQELEVLDADLAAWLTVWEIRSVEPGVGVSVSDLLTGEQRFVHEISGSRTLSARDAILGRVVDIGGVSVFDGVHPQPLAPHYADIIVREMRRICRVRTRAIKVERLRDLSVQLDMIDSWRDLVEQQQNRALPTFTNTDGDPFVVTTDHFDILSPDISSLITRLATFAGAEEARADDSEEGATVIVITKPGNARMKEWDNTVIGRIVIKARRMKVEANSIRRADALRSSITSHLGELVRYRLRDEVGQAELIRRAEESPERHENAPEDSPELASLARGFKERHMLGWLDEEIPALGGLTPREAAAKSRASRKSLDLLLREIENHEGRLPDDQRYDVGRLREALGVWD